MEATISMLKTIAVFVALAIPGFIMVKTKLVKSEHTIILSKILLYVGLPFLVFSTTENMDLNVDTLWLIIITAVITTVYTIIGFILSKFLVTKIDNIDKRKMARFCIVSGNTGFLGIPLAQAVFASSPLVCTSVIVVNVFAVTVIYTVGAYILSEDKSAISIKGIVLNPVVIAFVLGIIANVTKVSSYVPEIMTFSNYLSSIVTPLSMLVLGIKLGEIDFKKTFTSPLMYKVSFYKLVAFPVLITAILLLLKLILPISDELIYGIFIGHAMPVAASATTYADNFKCDVEGSVTYTLGTTILSIATISLLYFILVLVI